MTGASEPVDGEPDGGDPGGADRDTGGSVVAYCGWRLRPAERIFVDVYPGQRSVTPTCGAASARSNCNDSLIAAIACFDAWYGPPLALAPSDIIEPVLITWAGRPRSTMPGTNAEMPLIVPHMQTSITHRQSAGDNSHALPLALTPALLARMSAPPNCSSVKYCGGAEILCRGHVGDEEFDGRTGRPQSPGCVLQGVVFDVEHDDVHLLGGERGSERIADPACRAGDGSGVAGPTRRRAHCSVLQAVADGLRDAACFEIGDRHI